MSTDTTYTAAELAANAALHQEALIDNLCMLLARCARRLRKHKEHVEDHKLAEQAENFLRVNGRLGDILREVEPHGR